MGKILNFKNYENNESEINNIHKEINYYLFFYEKEKRINNNNDNLKKSIIMKIDLIKIKNPLKLMQKL